MSVLNVMYSIACVKTLFSLFIKYIIDNIIFKPVQLEFGFVYSRIVRIDKCVRGCLERLLSCAPV